jgi:hypothetical protein
VYWPVLPQLEEVEPSNVEKAFHLMSKWEYIVLNCIIYLLSSPPDLLNRNLGILSGNKNFWIDIKFNFKTIWANLLFYSKFYYEIYLIVVDFIEFYPARSTKF